MPRKSRARPADDIAFGFADRLENLEKEKRSLVHSIKDLLSEAADAGLPKQALQDCIKRRLETPEAKEKRETRADELNALMRRLGMLADTPLGRAAANVTEFRRPDPELDETYSSSTPAPEFEHEQPEPVPA